jgi:hypothetical protein
MPVSALVGASLAVRKFGDDRNPFEAHPVKPKSAWHVSHTQEHHLSKSTYLAFRAARQLAGASTAAIDDSFLMMIEEPRCTKEISGTPETKGLAVAKDDSGSD